MFARSTEEAAESPGVRMNSIAAEGKVYGIIFPGHVPQRYMTVIICTVMGSYRYLTKC